MWFSIHVGQWRARGDLRSHRFPHRSHDEPLASPPLSLEPPLDDPESEPDDPLAMLQFHADDDSLRKTVPLSAFDPLPTFDDSGEMRAEAEWAVRARPI